MRVSTSPRALGYVMAIVLHTVLASALHLGFLPQDISSHFSRRSLPGSLATAPEGAVGHYVPPGSNYLPEETDVAPTSTVQGTHHELRTEPATNRNAAAEDGLATVTRTDTGTSTQTVAPRTSIAIASRDVGLGITGLSLSLSVLLGVLQL